MNINRHEKRLTVKRAGKQIKVEPFQRLELQHEDVVVPVQGVDVK